MLEIDNSSERPVRATSRPRTLEPVRLCDQVRDSIRELILDGALRPGDRIVENKLAKEFGVGQNAVREALIELSHMGFVRRIPNKGTYVTQLSQADAEKIAQVRAPLEALVVDLVARRLQSEELDLSSVDHSLSQMKSCAQAGDMIAFYEHDIRFHRTLWHLSGNEYLAQLLELLVVPLFAFFTMIHLNPAGRTDWIRDALARHEGVMEALKTRSLEKAHEAILQLEAISMYQQWDILTKLTPKDASPAKSRGSTILNITAVAGDANGGAAHASTGLSRPE